MPQIVLDFDDKELERKLMNEARKKGRKLSDVVLDILRKTFIPNQKNTINYKNLDPMNNMSRIEYTPADTPDMKEKDLENVFPFEDVKNSGAFIRKIRKNGTEIETIAQ